jgi:hypothetical protein
MGEDRISEIGDRSSEGQAAGLYRTGFTRVGAMDRTMGLGIKDSSD